MSEKKSINPRISLEAVQHLDELMAHWHRNLSGAVEFMIEEYHRREISGVGAQEQAQSETADR